MEYHRPAALLGDAVSQRRRGRRGEGEKGREERRAESGERREK